MRQYIKYYFSNNIIEYLKLFCVFTIGVVVSIFVINNSNSLEQEEIRNFINSKISIVKSNDYDNKNDVFNNSLNPGSSNNFGILRWYDEDLIR